MDRFFGLDKAAKADKGTVLLTTVHDEVEKNLLCGILEEEKIPFLLNIEDLRTCFKSKYEQSTVLDGVSIHLKRGEIIGVVGEYIGRIYLSINRYPQFVVRSVTRGEAAKETEHEDHARSLGA